MAIDMKAERIAITEESKKCVSWFIYFTTSILNYSTIHEHYKFILNKSHALQEMDLDDDLSGIYIEKFRKKFNKIVESYTKAYDALVLLTDAIPNSEQLRIAWRDDHVEKHYSTVINKFVKKWKERCQDLDKACKCSTLQELVELYPRTFYWRVDKYLYQWMDPAEDVHISAEADASIDANISCIMLMWIIETIRSEDGPALIKKLMKEHNFTMPEFTRVFPDPVEEKEEKVEKDELTIAFNTVAEAWEALQDHKYDEVYQVTYATAREHLDELLSKLN